MQESFKSALLDTLSDFDLYGLYIFLPCILALVFTVLHKKHKRKKMWKTLLAFVPLVIIYKTILFESIFDDAWFEVFVIFAIFYAISIVVGITFWKKKLILALSVPLILCCSYLSFATYKFFDNMQPFGRIDEYSLPSHIHSNYDYAVKITYADAWGYNLYSMTIRGKHSTDTLENDTISYCIQHGQNKDLTVKYIPKDTDKKKAKLPPATQKNCKWEPLTDDKISTFFEFKNRAENYHSELECEHTCNKYEFNVGIINYKKKTFRSLELGHASMHIPMAQEIVNLGLKLIDAGKDSIDNDSAPQ